MHANLVQIGLQINQLRFEFFPVFGQHRQELFQLRRGVARAVVGVDDFLGLDQRQPEPLGAQGELEPRAVTRCVNAIAPARPFALGLQQTHVFVKAHRPRRQVELAGQVADGVGGGHKRGRM